ncbi:MAG: V-type ATPase subunit [Candidatus Hodarchaeales archaeon]|jgi:vacuolar-type H+-ATPase subunit C/Vma6
MAFHQIQEAKDYSFINARIKARRSQLLSTSDYENLLSISLEDGITGLHEHPRYQDTFEDISFQSPQLPLFIEKSLNDSIRLEMQSLMQNLPEKDQIFFKFYFKKGYLKIIEDIIHKLHNSDTEPLDLTNRYIASPEERVELIHATQVSSINELMEAVSPKWLQKAIESSLDVYKKTDNPLEIAYRMERAFYEELWKNTISILKRTSKTIAEKALGIEIDLNNISIILRKKSNSKIVASLDSLVIPLHYRLKADFDDLMNASSLTSAFSVLESTYYVDFSRKVRNSFSTINSLELLEQIQQEHYLQSLTGIMAGYPFHLGILFSYYHYRKQEIENLRIIFESKIKEVDIEFTRNLLIYSK